MLVVLSSAGMADDPRKLLKLSTLDPKIRALQRRVIGYAEDVVMDVPGGF